MSKTLQSLQNLLCYDMRSVQQILDEPEKYYTSKTQPKMKFGRPQLDEKGNIKLRHLNPPLPFLKFIQRQICSHLQSIDLPCCMYGSVEESNNILNALQHINNKFFLTIDLRSFFDNITNTQVNQLFIDNHFSWNEARILTKLTTHQRCLPQGAPTSPVLANLAFVKTAKQLQAFIEKDNITFTTFLDDLTFSSTKDFKFLIPNLLDIIKQNKFYPHNKKIHYRKDSCEITGLIVGNGKLKLTAELQKEASKNQRRKVYALNVKKQYQEYLMSRKLEAKAR